MISSDVGDFVLSRAARAHNERSGDSSREISNEMCKSERADERPRRSVRIISRCEERIKFVEPFINYITRVLRVAIARGWRSDDPCPLPANEFCQRILPSLRIYISHRSENEKSMRERERERERGREGERGRRNVVALAKRRDGSGN